MKGGSTASHAQYQSRQPFRIPGGQRIRIVCLPGSRVLPNCRSRHRQSEA